jgi:DNA topoisomerase I
VLDDSGDESIRHCVCARACVCVRVCVCVCNRPLCEPCCGGGAGGQEASRKLSMPSKETMRVAQSLYEAGYITYMRTDNPVLSESALALARECVTARYGAASLASGPGRGAHKPKGSQEAHEAIRPAVSESDQGHVQQMRSPEASGLSGRELALYQLVYQRTLASVMVDAELELTSVHVRARRKAGSEGLFRAGGRVIVKAGWMAAYQQGDETGEEASLAGGAGQEGGAEDGGRLPKLVKGQPVDCSRVVPEGHETKAPARYTEASFVKELETLGIGRPSTYAQILDTLKEREYVSMLGKALVPSLTAFVVISLLESNFKDFVDTAFTAKMEERLDEIAQGVGSKEAYLSEYYLGDRGLRSEIQRMEVSIDAEKARRVSLPILESEDAKGISIFVGPYGAYVEKREAALEGGDEQSKVIKAKLPADMCTNVELLTLPVLQQCLNTRQGPYNGSLIGEHPDTAQPVLLKIGPFGAYIQLGEDSADASGSEGGKGPKRVSLPKGASILDMNMTSALKYLSCPRVVCLHPESGEEIRVGIGRFGAFIQHKGAYKSLGPGDDILTLDRDRALQLVQEMGSAKPSGAICELGEHAGAKVVVMDGRYGPYIKWKSVNARLPAEFKEHPREVPLSAAVEAILAKDPKAARASKATASAATTVRTRAKKPTLAASKPNAPGAAVIAKKAANPRARATARTPAASRGVATRSAAVPAATQGEQAVTQDASNAKRPRNAYIIFCQVKRLCGCYQGREGPEDGARHRSIGRSLRATACPSRR